MDPVYHGVYPVDEHKVLVPEEGDVKEAVIHACTQMLIKVGRQR